MQSIHKTTTSIQLTIYWLLIMQLSCDWNRPVHRRRLQLVIQLIIDYSIERWLESTSFMVWYLNWLFYQLVIQWIIIKIPVIIDLNYYYY